LAATLKNTIRGLLISALSAATLVALAPQPAQADSGNNRKGRKPNILFVMMDDIGIDQLSTLGYGGDSAPPTPTINTIASTGLRFRNTWSMPECSNGRMALLTGRYPFRTNVYQAIGQNDLANSQVSPYDVTVSRMLKQAGYKSALFGKYHLGGPDNNEVGNGGPGRLGWDFFYGWIGGVPGSIDTTAGGIGTSGQYSCGYIPSTARAATGQGPGANSGACYVPRSKGRVSCEQLTGDTLGDSPGLTCLNMGGVLVPNAACQPTPPSNVTFNVENAHYVSPLVVNRGPRVLEASLDDPRARNYRSTIEVNSAIRWINEQKRSRDPWMATVSFSAGHTPIQTPPGHLLSQATRDKLAAAMDSAADGTNCDNLDVERVVSDAMIEAMDTELGRLLVQTGLATRDGSGGLVYDPKASNTMIVIIGDNGSFGDLVKTPFDPTRAKSTPYQTGVWVPLVVAGPMVTQPNRDVPHMTNATDVFGLFGEMAGLNPQKATSPRKIDSKPMLAYLRNPQQASIRSYNFTQGGQNIQLNGGDNGACVLGASDTSTGNCSQSPLDKSICEENGGVWWGPGATDPTAVALTNGQGVQACWQVNQAIYNSNPNTYSTAKVSIEPQSFYATRDNNYKYVVNSWLDFDPETSTTQGTLQTQEEFYEVNEDTSDLTLKIDRDGDELYELMNGIVVTDNLSGPAEAAFETLKAYAAAEFATQPPCPGDGTGDLVVNTKDLAGYRATVRNWSGSSMFDFDYNGVTDSADRQTILSNFPSVCR